MSIQAEWQASMRCGKRDIRLWISVNFTGVKNSKSIPTKSLIDRCENVINFVVVVEDGMSGTHKNTHGSWILWSVLRVRSKTMHSLFCITPWLPYITLRFIDSRFFSAPGKIAHGSIRLPPRSLASSRGCSLAIINLGLQYTMRDKSVETLP